MTTHYQKIQALGNKIADNLTTMGISSSFGEGGLTLADKILQIQHFTNGLLMYAENKILQAGESIGGYALLLDDGKPMSGETVVFYDSLHPSITHDGNGVLNPSRNVGTSFNIYYSAQPAYSTLFYLESSDTTLIFESDGDVLLKTGDSTWDTLFRSAMFIQLNNGILSDDLGHTYDLSGHNTNFTINKIMGVCKIYINVLGVGVTDDNGVAEFSYTGSGVGKRNIIAKSGSVVSEPYTVIDSILAFDGSSVTSNFVTNANITLSVDNGFVKMVQSGTGRTQYFSVNGSSTGYLDPTKDYRIEFDYIASDTGYNLFYMCGSGMRLSRVGDTSEHHIKIEQISGVINMYFDNNTSSADTQNVGSNTDCSFGLNQVSSIKVKNFKLYLI